MGSAGHKKRVGLLAVPWIGLLLAVPNICEAVDLSLHVGGEPELAPALQIIVLLTVLSLAPALILMVTSFTRIVVVLAFVRQALGTHQMPAGQVLIGLSLFLTVFVMTPVWSKVKEAAVDPYLQKQITQQEALQRAVPPVREFMLRQTRQKDILLFIDLTKKARPAGPEDIPITLLIPAFMISELKTAFQIGFILYLPFLILDLVIASLLLSMGMMMLPPMMISLPLKLVLFVLVDGWNLLIGSLLKSFG
jgi:flagellar biosynthetic protein FliP